jgi:DNA-binding response OmpR family regulator
LTKELVEILKGQIDVQSTPGKGTTFTVCLPLGKERWSAAEIVTDEIMHPVPAEHPDALGTSEQGTAVLQPGAEPQAGAPVVLLVEDNADVRVYIRGFLEGTYRIVEAQNGQEALEIAHNTTIDLLISDIMMPVMDGVAMCKALKNDETTSHIPVILLTARASGEGKLEGLESGADDYIIKPFDVRELQARIQNLIELRKALQEKYRRQCVLEPGDIPIESMDEKFLRKALDVVEEHLSETDFETVALARELCMSRMQLNRKLHALTGRSTHQFIRNLRLQRAAKLLRSQWGNVTEVAFEVGFTSLSSFARAFREEFGVSPSKYCSRDT